MSAMMYSSYQSFDSSAQTDFAKCSYASFNPYEMNGHNQYYQYNPYAMQTQQMAPAMICLDDYTDDSDCESQPETPIAKPALAKPTMTTTTRMEDKEEETMTSSTNSPRSPEASTLEPDSDSFSVSVESDAEDVHSRYMIRSAPEESHETFTVVSLLKLRHAVSWLDGIEDLSVKAVDDPSHWREVEVEQPPKPVVTRTTKPKKTPKKDNKVIRRKGCGSDTSSGSEEILVSEDSWAAQQSRRRLTEANKAAESVSDEEVMRAMKSILNKLTMEKFTALYEKLVSCGIRTSAHVNALMSEVFEKATTQHHFTNMYADLCALLRSHFEKCPIVDNPDMSFETLLLNSREAFLEKRLNAPLDVSGLDDEDRLVAECRYKMQKLGNTKFFGALLVRELLDAKLLIDACQELLLEPTTENLELLAALLTVVGQKFDSRQWSFHSRLIEVFDKVQDLVNDPQINRRVCFLLKDLLELRGTRWWDRKPKSAEGPSTLKEVADTQAAEEADALASSPSSRGKKLDLAASFSDTKCKYGRRCTRPGCWYKHPKGRLVDEEEGEADAKDWRPTPKDPPSATATKKQNKSSNTKKQAWEKEIAATVKELRISLEVKEALSRISALGVPPPQQPKELVHMLGLMADQPSKAIRKVFFEMVARLFSEGVWSERSLTEGLSDFLENVCPDLQCDIPALSTIIWDELHPAIAPLVSKAIS